MDALAFPEAKYKHAEGTLILAETLGEQHQLQKWQ